MMSETLGHHGKTLSLLKKNSKKARVGFKRKKLSVAGSYQEIKGRGGMMMAAGGSRPSSQTGPPKPSNA